MRVRRLRAPAGFFSNNPAQPSEGLSGKELLKLPRGRFGASLKRCEAPWKRGQRRFEACLKRCEARLTCFEALPDPTAISGNMLRESLTGERARAAQPATTPASSLKPSALDELSGNWTPAVNRQPWLPPGTLKSFLAFDLNGSSNR